MRNLCPQFAFVSRKFHPSSATLSASVKTSGENAETRYIEINRRVAKRAARSSLRDRATLVVRRSGIPISARRVVSNLASSNARVADLADGRRSRDESFFRYAIFDRSRRS